MNAERLRALYPTLADDELKEARANLSRYFSCALKIASDSQTSFIDKRERPDTIKERSNGSLKNTSFKHG